MTKKTQEQLRVDIRYLDQRISQLERAIETTKRDLLVLKEEKRDLLRQLLPNRERCQVCMGTKKRTVTDVWSGLPTEIDCVNCHGTGVWTEPIT